jgi:Uma2 family endonuclease
MFIRAQGRSKVAQKSRTQACESLSNYNKDVQRIGAANFQPPLSFLRILDMSTLLTPSRHKLSAEDYHRMGQAGILGDNNRVELVEGELIDMAPIGSLHASVVSTLSMFFARQVGDLAIVSTQNPVSLPPDSEPQPDLLLLKPRLDRYRNALPTAADVMLLVEVADTTSKYDREIKLPMYARQGIAEVWLIDLKSGTIEIYREPSSKGYRKLLRPERSDTIAAALLGDVRLPITEIWPA